jgi:hypothetical protein
MRSFPILKCAESLPVSAAISVAVRHRFIDSLISSLA